MVSEKVMMRLAWLRSNWNAVISGLVMSGTKLVTFAASELGTEFKRLPALSLAASELMLM